MRFHVVIGCDFCFGVSGSSGWLWSLLWLYHMKSIPAEQGLVVTHRVTLLSFLGPSCLFTALKLVFTVMALFLFLLLECLVSCTRKEGDHDCPLPLFQEWSAGNTKLFKPLQPVSAANPSACAMLQVLDEMCLLENYCFTELLSPSILPPSSLWPVV